MSRRSQLLDNSRLYVLTDGKSSASEFEFFVESLVNAGVDVLQLRDKQLDDRELLERAHAIRRVTRETNTLFIMNDRPDLALLSDADGVHVGQSELGVQDVRRIVGNERLIGVSTHSIEQARQAVTDEADYIGCGPTFPSTTKRFEDFPGLRFLKQVSREINIPAFAIGGISDENLDSVLETEIGRVALSGIVCRATKPAAIVKQLKSSMLTKSIKQQTKVER